MVGPEPAGLALSADGHLAYVTVSSSDEVAVVDLGSKRVVKRIGVGRLPWAIAVSGNAEQETVVVTHRLARLREGGREATNDGKEAWVTVIQDDEMTEVTVSPYTFGFPNAVEGLTVVGDKAIITHLLNSPEEPNRFPTTLAGGISTISLATRQELVDDRMATDDSAFTTPVNFPRAVAVTKDGARAYVVLAGTDAVMGVDLNQPSAPKLLGFWAVGKNPRGIVLNSDGTRAYVMNYLSRDVSVLDLTDTVHYPEIARIQTTPETLEPDILRGKVLFNNANDPRMSKLGWMSCGSCHLDGGVDGTTWIIPEGHRQTMPLWKLDGTAPFHIAATRDEVQDFEGDIEQLMGGVGLASGPAERLLGSPNGGKSSDLDALAAFVLRGARVPQAREADGAADTRGREAFVKAGCNACHAGPAWTTSHLPGEVGTLAPAGEVVETILHNVGTYNPQTDILGEKGFDVPTLLGLHASAPYLHDGSATSLRDVLSRGSHVGSNLKMEQIDVLIVFLRTIDESTEPIGPSSDSRSE